MEEDFEELFGMIKGLKVGTIKKRSGEKGHKRSCRNHLKTLGKEANVDEDLHKTRRCGTKSILKESKLKIHIKSNKENHKGPKNKSSCLDDTNKHGTSSNETDKKKQENTIHRSCSMEFRNPVTCNQEELLDLESNDLAEYFEQALFLPKPMSAMAEMMYG